MRASNYKSGGYPTPKNMPSKSLPRVKLAKICGDNNQADYVPDRFWAEGYETDEPCEGFTYSVCNLVASSDMVDPDAVFETPVITKLISTMNGYLMIADRELWSMQYL